MHAKISQNAFTKDLLRKYQEQQHEKQALQDDALAEARRVAGVLAKEYHACTVYLFGPLSYGEFREGLAIELAVDGMPPEMWAAAVAYVKQAGAFVFELAELAQVDAWIRRSIIEKGVRLVCQDDG